MSGIIIRKMISEEEKSIILSTLLEMAITEVEDE